MKPYLCLLLAAAFLTSAPAQSGEHKPSALLGAWAVDVSRLPMPPEARPKSVTITFAEASNDRLATRVEVIDAAGAKLFAEGTSTLDGTAVAVQGNLEADVAAATMPTPNVLVMQLAKGGVPASTRIYSVAEDGKSMIETVAYFTPDGSPGTRANYFSRIE